MCCRAWITRRHRGVSLARVLEELGRFTDGWVGYFWIARTSSVFQHLDEWVRRRLRCYQWKQWKTPRHRARELLKMGIGRYLAWGVAYNGAGLWHIAGCPAMTKSLTNAKLTAMGFHSLHEKYLALAST